jgi:hypothetical protein
MIATIIKAVMSSAAEAELGALFINAKKAVYLRQILEEMGHPQPRTPIQTNNTMVEEVINNKIQLKCTKAMDMRYHWLCNREAQATGCKNCSFAKTARGCDFTTYVLAKSSCLPPPYPPHHGVRWLL